MSHMEVPEVLPVKRKQKKKTKEIHDIDYVDIGKRWLRVYKKLIKVERVKPFRTSVLNRGKQVFNNLRDLEKQKKEKPLRLQTDINKNHLFVKKLERALIDVGELNTQFKIKNPRIMASLKGCPEQDMHYDYDPHLVNDFAKKYKIKPKIVVLAMKPGTKIVLKDPKTVSSCVEIVLNCGDCCVFDGDIVHCGDWYDRENIRLHLSLEYEGLTTSENTVFVPRSTYNWCRVDYDQWLENSSWQIQIEEKIEMNQKEKDKLKQKIVTEEKNYLRFASYYDAEIKKAEIKLNSLKRKKEEKIVEYKKKRQRFVEEETNLSDSLERHKTFINTMEKVDALRQKVQEFEEEAKKLEEGLRNDKDSEEILNNLMN